MALRRILGKHFVYHMAIPLAVGVLAEAIVIRAGGKTWTFVLGDLFTAQHAVPVIAIILAYWIVMVLIITVEGSTPFESSNYTKVEQQLQHATSYFALCDIPMREWFEPGAFKYFSLLASWQKASGGTFKYERVIVFTTDTQKRNAEATVLDRYHAEALATAHRRLGIPMGWLGPGELRAILSKSTPADQMLFLRIPPAWRRLPARWRRWPVTLDYAVIDRPSGKAVIIVPFKKREAAVLEGDEAAPYIRLAETIRGKVFEQDGTLRLDHDFPRLIGID
jgi:hypothetical protein